jgi:hypothetical protein
LESWKNSVLLLFVLIPLSAFPFGKTGHRIVGELAQRHLSPKALEGIEQILGKEKLAHAALWADEIKSDKKYDYAKVYHRMNAPKGSDLSKVELEKDSIIWALVNFEDVLRSSDSTMEEKKFALKFILHLVGDLHQPLHLGYGEDHGGNDVRVKWFQKSVNLHEVWDEQLILFEELSFTEYADKLDSMDKKSLETIQTGTYLDWAVESNSYLPLVYDFQSKNLSYEYHYKVKDALYSLLQKGGLRLAYTLNNIFEKRPLTDAEKELRKKLGF